LLNAALATSASCESNQAQRTERGDSNPQNRQDRLNNGFA
jgi:hypothetical protein